MKNVFKTVFVIVGTVIGAGFASGQEIFNFFNIHGTKGIFGLVISMSLIGVVCYKTFDFMLKNNIEDYNEMIDTLTGYKKMFSTPIQVLVKIFLLMSFYIMSAGFAAYFFQELGIPKIIGGIIISILSFITFSKGINGIVKVNLYLIPVLIIFTVLLGIKCNISLELIENQSVAKWEWLKDSILYASYNSIVLVPILIGLKKHIKNKKESIASSLFVSLLMSSVGIILYLALNKYKNEIINIEIPTVYIAGKFGVLYKYLYGITVLIGILTSAIASGYSFLTNSTKQEKNYKSLSILICFISVFISFFSFSNLINILYPIFGYLGIIQLFFLLIY